MVRKIKLSIVIPAYNEEKLIAGTIKKVQQYLAKKPFNWEVVVADDGSKDKTPKIIRGFSDKKIRLVRLAENKGKGGALREGILKAGGEFIIFMDADLSVPLKNIDTFMQHFSKGADVVVASRRVDGARIMVHQPWHREAMGRVFTLVTQIIMTVNIKDFTCGFKGFTKKAAIKIFGTSLINRWAYDAEILFLAKKFGFKIIQSPVVWRNRQDTRVRLKSVILETFRDLIKVRIYDLSGKYGN